MLKTDDDHGRPDVMLGWVMLWAAFCAGALAMWLFVTYAL